MRKVILLATAVAMFAVAAFAQGPDIGAKLDNFELPDTAGKKHSLESLKGKNGTVVIFLSAQCPVVEIYDERVNALAAEAKEKGINFIGINSNVTECLEWVKWHTRRTYKFPVLLDAGNVLADKLGATVTPEVYFIDAKNTLLYHGAIDNSRDAKDANEHFLKTAFARSLAGEKIERTRVKATGCTIKRVQDQPKAGSN